MQNRLGFIPILKKHIPGIAIYSRSTLIHHWSFWEKPYHMNFLPLWKATHIFSQSLMNIYLILTVTQHNNLLNVARTFDSDSFAGVFIAIFGFLCYILPPFAIYFSTFFFPQYVTTFLLKLLKSISMWRRLHENKTLLKSISHGFSICTTSKLVTDLYAELERHQK